MTISTQQYSPRLLIAAVIATVLFCAIAASAIISWTPDATGLPADIAAIYEQN